MCNFDLSLAPGTVRPTAGFTWLPSQTASGTSSDGEYPVQVKLQILWLCQLARAFQLAQVPDIDGHEKLHVN